MKTPRMARGALLLEILVALAILVPASLAIISLVGRSMDTLGEMRDRAHAADLARSAVAMIESGAQSAESLIGPAGRRLADDGTVEQGDGLDRAWELSIASEPGVQPGLMLLVVTASRSGRGPSGDPAGFTLRQYVKLPGGGVSVGGER